MQPANWFIGLPVRPGELPDGVLDSLPPGVRAFHPADLHVTVAFLGPVSRQFALAAWESTDWSRQPALEACIRGRAALGPRRRPSACGLDIGDRDGRLEAFIGEWRDRLLDAADRPCEKREVRPHVTLGRPRGDRSDTIRLREWLADDQPSTPITLDRIALYTRAEPTADRRFAIVRECELAQSAPHNEEDRT